MDDDTDRLESLLTDYLEGDLDDRGVGELQRLLAENEQFAEQASEMYRFHRLLGFLVKDHEFSSARFVQDTLRRLPKSGEEFTEEVMRKQHEMTKLPWDDREPKQKPDTRSSAAKMTAWACAASIVLLCGAWFLIQSQRAPQVAGIEEIKRESGVRIVKQAQVKLFGELSPKLESEVSLNKEYIMIAGMLELKFPDGAEVILEAPAVFQVQERDLLVMDMGVCSVYAPPGAEGFRVVTPGSTIVDRGTRFSVKVDESNQTEVHMVEGLADVHPVSFDQGEGKISPEMIQLTDQQALLMHDVLESGVTEAVFDKNLYRKQLPDRIVSYEATRSDQGHAEDLLSVTVQRDGEEMVYSFDEMIKVDVTWFRAADEVATGYLMTAPGDSKAEGEDPNEVICVTQYDYLLTGSGAAVSPRTLLADRSLITGTINPGGALTPLTESPVMFRDILAGAEGTPGLAVRFHEPVVNGPGPDIVFFELQPVIYPDGDAFHVSPLDFRSGLKSHTIRDYDLNLHSSEALRVTQPYVHFSKDQVVKSLEDLTSMELLTRPTKLIYRAVAVGIDLSDLGYAPGEAVDGLFFQDAMDDRFQIDPVFIGGLPVR